MSGARRAFAGSIQETRGAKHPITGANGGVGLAKREVAGPPQGAGGPKRKAAGGGPAATRVAAAAARRETAASPPGGFLNTGMSGVCRPRGSSARLPLLDHLQQGA